MWQKCYYSVMYFNGYQIIVGGGTQQPFHYKCSYRVNRTHTQCQSATKFRIVLKAEVGDFGKPQHLGR